MKPEINTIIQYLDSFMAQGGGHVNVKVDGQKETKKEIGFSCDCTENTACKAPTLYHGMDEENSEYNRRK